MSIEQWLVGGEQGKTEEIKKKLLQLHFVRYECHVISFWLEADAFWDEALTADM
jgi:hypothetical protein